MGRVAENLERKDPRDIAIPAVVLYELEVGIAGSVHALGNGGNRWTALLESPSTFFRFIERAASAWRNSGALEKAGSGIGPIDT